jgi:hypothetical protein
MEFEYGLEKYFDCCQTFGHKRYTKMELEFGITYFSQTKELKYIKNFVAKA